MGVTSRRDAAGLLTFGLPYLGIFAVGVVAVLAPALPTPLRYLPLLASVVLLGLPHGAVDHLALPRVRGAAPDREWFGRVGAIYLVLGVAYAVVWFLSPTPGIVSFVLLTWFHWGQGDLHPLLSVAGVDHLRTSRQRLLLLIVRGGLPMLVPLLSHPGRYRAVVAEILGLFDVAPASVAPLFRVETRLALGIGFAAVSTLALALGWVRATDRRGWRIDAGETLLLWAFFWVVPPVLAIGIYFTTWHSPRHVARLLEVDPGVAEREPPRIALARFAREATPLTLLSLLFLVGLYLLVPNPPTDVPGIVALYLVFIAVLTLPHVAIVTDMDRVQGIWSAAEETGP